ncbi:MAG: DUF507 domain-containing protein [Thermodesulfovibrio sp.]|nr:DUF507 domain-containing protein [Thermodesulfovibrio sp.]
MRIPKSWVPILAKRITENLIEKEMVVLSVPEDKLLAKVEEFITEELMVEDRLNDEVRLILNKYASDIEGGRMDYRKLFDLTKQKLVRERNLIL